MKKKKVHPRSAGAVDQSMGQRIRVLRLERKMSQDELGKALGVTFQQVQKYEKGANRVAAPRLQEIAAVFDVPITTFYDKGSKGQAEVQSLLFTDSNFSVRVLRAYNALPKLQRRRVVSLLESMAGVAVPDGEDDGE